MLVLPASNEAGRSKYLGRTTARPTQELLMGFEPMNLVLTKDALYQLSYSSLVALRGGTVAPGLVPNVPARNRPRSLDPRLPDLPAERVKGVEPS